MPRLSFIAFILLSLLALSLAYYAQSATSPLGPAPHLGFGLGLKIPLALSAFVAYTQAAIQAPFRSTQRTGYDAEPPHSVVDVDWDNADPTPPYTRRIIAVGDLHGDIENAVRVLQMAGVVDADNAWSGNVDVLVQTGDIIDRGDDTIQLFEWFEELREQARDVGGILLTHLGNHEMMNAIGDWRYVYPSEIDTFGSIAERQKALSTGWLGKAWTANYTIASRLPLHSSLGPPNTDYPPPNGSPFAAANAGALSHAAFSFVHGGLAPTYPNLTPFPSAINNIGASLLRKLRARVPQPPPHPPNAYPGLPGNTSREEVRLYSGDGPLWYRGWAEEEETTICPQVDEVLKKTGTRRMVMGHTPDFDKIVSRCGGRVIIIDTGISHAYGGKLSALSIEYTLTPVRGGGKKEQEVIKALYADQEDELLLVDSRDLTGDLL
ncbi:Metallo-dependent phosphatase-like protein [Hygrophoropsis aurantiaca]|uniref:Metallo-dependent phosphatase-like protein n=1 Tax=Hygrophoropsis aurantiaca TaxID=72124 RepID=A0ACB8AKL6_9AGAM|nr:Metallo-dependent phosphatase-like protein [Hygrophoropsis aurantiaca]